MTTPYVTFAEYRAYMDAETKGRPAGYTEAGVDFVTGLLTAATEFIERETERTFSAVTRSRFYGPRAVSIYDFSVLNLDADLLEVTTLTNGDGTTIPAGGFRLQPRNATRFDVIELKSAYRWTFDTDGEVEVAGKWGYSLTPGADVKRVVCRLAYLEQARRFSTGEVEVLEGGFQFDTIIPRDLRDWLRGMKRARPA